MVRSIATMVIAPLAFFLPASALSAQRVFGPGDDAHVLAAGVFRVRTLGEWSSFNERYGKGTRGRAANSLEPLGVDLTLDTLGVIQLPNLAALQAGVRSVSGLSAFDLSLGDTRLVVQDRIRITPVLFEIGLGRRLSAGVEIPYVKTHSEVFFNVNTAGNNGNVGFNPALSNRSTFAADTMLVNELNRAAAQLSSSLAACAGSSSSTCAPINANRSSAQALAASTTTFATGLSQIYPTSRFVPIAGTAAQLAIEARIASIKSQFQSFGVNAITSSGPFAAQTRLTMPDLQLVLTDSAYGFVLSPLRTTDRSHFGDVDIGAKFQLYDSFGGSAAARMEPRGVNIRAAVAGIIRLPTGQTDSPDNLVDVGTGSGQRDIEGRVFLDVLVGPRYWQSFIVRYNDQLSDEQTVRITDQPERVLAPLYRRQTVRRDLGNVLELETTPRWVVNGFLAVSGQYLYRHKSQDRYTGSFAIPASVTGYSDITINASTLDLETEATEHRFGGGVAFSNLEQVERRKARIPFEVSYLHQQTISGSGGNQPKYFVDQIQLRLYSRLFGR